MISALITAGKGELMSMRQLERKVLLGLGAVVFLCLCGSAQGQTCVDRLKVEGVHPSLRSRVDQLLAKGTVKDFITQAGGVDQALAKARRQLAEGEQMLASDEGRCSTNPNCSKEHIYKGQAAVLMSRALVAAVECRTKIAGEKR